MPRATDARLWVLALSLATPFAQAQGAATAPAAPAAAPRSVVVVQAGRVLAEPGKAPLGRQVGVVATFGTLLALSLWTLWMLATLNL